MSNSFYRFIGFLTFHMSSLESCKNAKTNWKKFDNNLTLKYQKFTPLSARWTIREFIYCTEIYSGIHYMNSVSVDKNWSSGLFTSDLIWLIAKQ